MLDQFVNKKPTSRNEFGEMIPLYLRQPSEGKGNTGTSQEESRSYLDSVLQTISEFVWFVINIRNLPSTVLKKNIITVRNSLKLIFPLSCKTKRLML